MVSNFLDMAFTRLDVLAIISVAIYLISALSILLSHLAYHKPTTPGGKFLAAAAVAVVMLLLAPRFGGLMGYMAAALGMVLARWVRPGKRFRIPVFALLPVAIVAGVWLYGTWDDASLRYEARRRIAAEDAREKAETDEFLKREYFSSPLLDSGLAFEDGGEIVMAGTRFRLPVPLGYRSQFGAYREYGVPRWALRLDNPANGDYFIAIFRPPTPSGRRDAVSETGRARFYSEFFWHPADSPKYPGGGTELEHNSPRALFAVMHATDPHREESRKRTRRVFGASLAARERDVMLEIFYNPRAVGFGLSLPATWLNRFAEANGDDAALPPSAVEAAAGRVMAKDWPEGMTPRDQRRVDPTESEWFFSEAAHKPAPAFGKLDGKNVFGGNATLPIPEGWEGDVTPSAEGGAVAVFQTDGNTFVNFHMRAVDPEPADSPDAFLNLLRRRWFSPAMRDETLSEFGNIEGYGIEPLAPGRMARNMPDSVLIMQPVTFKKNTGGAETTGVGSIFVAGFILSGRPVYGGGTIASADGVDISYLLPFWLDALAKGNQSAEAM